MSRFGAAYGCFLFPHGRVNRPWLMWHNERVRLIAARFLCHNQDATLRSSFAREQSCLSLFFLNLSDLHL